MLRCKHPHDAFNYKWRCPFVAPTNSQLLRHQDEHKAGSLFCPTCQTWAKNGWGKHFKTKYHQERVVSLGLPWIIAEQVENGMLRVNGVGRECCALERVTHITTEIQQEALVLPPITIPRGRATLEMPRLPVNPDLGTHMMPLGRVPVEIPDEPLDAVPPSVMPEVRCVICAHHLLRQNSKKRLSNSKAKGFNSPSTWALETVFAKFGLSDQCQNEILHIVTHENFIPHEVAKNKNYMKKIDNLCIETTV